MSARHAVYSLLAEDPVLVQDFQLGPDRIWATYAIDALPRTGYTLVIRWGNHPFEIETHGPQDLSVWCYRSLDAGRDYAGHLRILERVIYLLTNTIGREGEDGYLNQAFANGMSDDFVDEVYGATAMNASFTVLAR